MKFYKQERLKSKKLIAELFAEGSASFIYPFRLVYLTSDSPLNKAPTQVLFSVSKRHFKRAVDRNRLKRQMREIYRLNKHLMQNPSNGDFPLKALGILYIAKKKLPFSDMQEKMCRAFKEFRG